MVLVFIFFVCACEILRFGGSVVFPRTLHTVSLQDNVGVGRIRPFIAG